MINKLINLFKNFTTEHPLISSFKLGEFYEFAQNDNTHFCYLFLEYPQFTLSEDIINYRGSFIIADKRSQGSESTELTKIQNILNDFRVFVYNTLSENINLEGTIVPVSSPDELISIRVNYTLTLMNGFNDCITPIEVKPEPTPDFIVRNFDIRTNIENNTYIISFETNYEPPTIFEIFLEGTLVSSIETDNVGFNTYEYNHQNIISANSLFEVKLNGVVMASGKPVDFV